MKRFGLTAAATIVMATASVSVADAAKPSRILATPKNVCSILVHYQAVSYTTLGTCAANLRADVANFRFPSDDDPHVLISLSQRCEQFEGEGLTYPFTFEEGPEWPFPVLTAQNRQQCARVLYTYHTLADALFGEG